MLTSSARPRPTSTPTPAAARPTLPARGRVFPIYMSKWQAVARMERSEIRGRRDRPTRIPLRSMRATNKPAVHFHFTCQIARAANAAPPGENGCRAPPIVLFSVSPRGWERRGRRVSSTYLSALSTRTRVPVTEERGPPLGAPRGFVSSKELSGSTQERASTRTPLRSPRGTTVLSSRLIPRASRVPGYEPDPQAPHSRSASGSSRETPLGEPEHKSTQFCFSACQEMFWACSEFRAILRDARAARGLLVKDQGVRC